MMKIKVSPAVGPDGLAAEKIEIVQGGYRKDQLPEEYLKGDCFWVKNGKHQAIVIRTRLNPINKATTPSRHNHKIYLSRTFTHAQLEALVGFMRECGERLVMIKELQESGYLKEDPVFVEI